MASESGAGAQPGIMTLELADKAGLYAAYMPFITNGGLFVPAQEREPDEFGLGDEVFLLLNIREQGERIPVAGRVVWVTPMGAQSQRSPGIGIQFSSQDGGSTQQKIEALLAGGVSSDRATHTL